MNTDFEPFKGINYQLAIINEAKEKVRSALKLRDEVQAKQFGIGRKADPLDHDSYEMARIDAQAQVNVYANALIDTMDIYTRDWK